MTSKPQSNPVEMLTEWLKWERLPMAERDDEGFWWQYDPRPDVERLLEQLEAANRALSWYEDHRDREGNYDGLMYGPLDKISNPASDRSWLADYGQAPVTPASNQERQP